MSIAYQVCLQQNLIETKVVQFLGYSAELRAVIGFNKTNISKYKNFANEIIKIQESKTNNSKKMKEGNLKRNEKPDRIIAVLFCPSKVMFSYVTVYVLQITSKFVQC